MELINPSRKHCVPQTGACATFLLILLPAAMAMRHEVSSPPSPADTIDCIGTYIDVECFIDDGAELILPRSPVVEE
jgi:hypothetical protein